MNRNELLYDLIKGKDLKSFALYRKPSEKDLSKLDIIESRLGEYFTLIVDKNEEVMESLTLTPILSQEGFIIAPFHASKKSPFLLIHPYIKENINVKELEKIENYNLQYKERDIEKELASYKTLFEKTKEKLKDQQFKKIVIAREHQLEMTQQLINPLQLFLKTCKLYPNQFVALWNTPQSGMWLTATPELLYAKKADMEETMALAGTMPWDEKSSNPDLSNWSKKNKEEQQLVTQYIKDILEKVGCQPNISKVEPLQAANLAHLCTRFSFKTKDAKMQAKILTKLHPTPAICGLPKERALKFLLNREPFNRKYYAGFSGFWSPKDQKDLFVSLRCMNIEKKYVNLYAGGGILPESTFESEWIETQRKLLIMLYALD